MLRRATPGPLYSKETVNQKERSTDDEYRNLLFYKNRQL